MLCLCRQFLASQTSEAGGAGARNPGGLDLRAVELLLVHRAQYPPQTPAPKMAVSVNWGSFFCVSFRPVIFGNQMRAKIRLGYPELIRDLFQVGFAWLAVVIGSVTCASVMASYSLDAL